MSAGRGIEQLIAEWLVDEAAPGAPDRVLDSTRHAVHRTNQRRFAAIWRESMFTPARLAAMAAMLVIALGAGLWIGRATAPVGPAAPASTPSPTVAATGADSGAILATYRAQRNAICLKYNAPADALKAKLDGMYDPALPAADRAIKVQAVKDLIALVEPMYTEMEALAPPEELAKAHLLQIANYRQQVSLINQALVLLAKGKYAEAEALDLATDPISREIEAFENTNSLKPCP